MLNNLTASLSVLSVELVPIHQRLVALRKELAVMSAEPKVNKTEFKAIVEELRKIDSYVVFVPITFFCLPMSRKR
jgi:hypothetical protein